jgi:hypothetical protein
VAGIGRRDPRVTFRDALRASVLSGAAVEREAAGGALKGGTSTARSGCGAARAVTAGELELGAGELALVGNTSSEPWVFAGATDSGAGSGAGAEGMALAGADCSPPENAVVPRHAI